MTHAAVQSFDTPIDRYESKYRIPPARLAEIRSRLRRYCEPDPKSVHGSYLVASLYFDSPRRVLYRQGIEKSWKRLKLRVRRYVDGPYFFEVKRRHKRLVLKSRVGVDPAWWPRMLLDPAALAASGLDERARSRAEFFLSWHLRLHAEPVVVVRYRREAYVSTIDRYARVTLDTELQARPGIGYAIPIEDAAGWLPLDDPSTCGLPVSGAILELKATTAVPAWMTDLVQDLGLRAQGFSKFARGLEAVEQFPRALRVDGGHPQRGRWRPW